MGCRSKPVRCCARCEDALHLAMLHSILRCSVCRLVWSLCLLRATKCVRPQVNECIADAIFSLAVYDVVVTAWLVRSKPAVVFLLVSATCADMIRCYVCADCILLCMVHCVLLCVRFCAVQ